MFKTPWDRRNVPPMALVNEYQVDEWKKRDWRIVARESWLRSSEQEIDDVRREDERGNR